MNYAELYVLNVGHGSCTVIEHASGRLSMIDINNCKALPEDERAMLSLAESKEYEAELEDPIAWMKANKAGREIWRFVLSHPDADHMEGLHRILGEQELSLAHFWDLPHAKPTPEKFRTPGQQLDWEVYQDYRRDPDSSHYEPKLIMPLRSAEGEYWTEDGVEVLSPDLDLIESCEDGTYEPNDMSRILRFSHGGRSVLLPGDVEEKAWENTLEAVGSRLGAEVLVASHHGRRSGYPPQEVMEEIDPRAAILSAASLPAKHDATPWYEAECDAVLSTRVDGTVAVRIWDDGELWIWRASDAAKLFELPAL